MRDNFKRETERANRTTTEEIIAKCRFLFCCSVESDFTLFLTFFIHIGTVQQIEMWAQIRPRTSKSTAHQSVCENFDLVRKEFERCLTSCNKIDRRKAKHFMSETVWSALCAPLIYPWDEQIYNRLCFCLESKSKQTHKIQQIHNFKSNHSAEKLSQ